jgi:two-component sensor histidine kinase
MVLHELVTNAAQYGALSTPHGRVEVEWTRAAGENSANLSIAWREIGGPAVPASPACRYGISIIREFIPQELGGSVDLAFASSGVCCKIEVPLESLSCSSISRPKALGLDVPTTVLARADEVIE